MKKAAKFLGLQMSQTDRAINFWECVLNKTPFARFIEIGTEHGTMSIYFYLYCQINNADFITVDIKYYYRPVFVQKLLGDSYKQFDVFSTQGVNFITNLIAKPGRTILFCDGGDKAKELQLFTPYLKSGDYIAVHDWGDALWQGDVPAGLHPEFTQPSVTEGLTRIWSKE